MKETVAAAIVIASAVACAIADRMRVRVNECAFTIVASATPPHAIPSHTHSALASSTAFVNAPTKKRTRGARRGTNDGVMSKFPLPFLQNYEYLDSVNYHFR